jgi:hypothetical protein
VRVARQYTGTVGKVTNCQVAVTCTYAKRALALPIRTSISTENDDEWAGDIIHLLDVSAYDLSCRSSVCSRGGSVMSTGSIQLKPVRGMILAFTAASSQVGDLFGSQFHGQRADGIVKLSI